MKDTTGIETLSFIYESLDTVEDFLYTINDKKFIEEIYSYPIKYASLDNLEKLRDAYLTEYISDPDKIENLIPFDEFDEYYNEIKDLLIYSEETQLALPEVTEETLIENGFYQSEFVVHDHHATSDHWDLRWKTKFGNSAYSFAIPKSKLPDDVNDKVLAIRQPMHPAIWVDLKSTDTFKDETQRGSMGSIKLVDRGKAFIKERSKSFIIHLEGTTIKDNFILIHVGQANSYIIMKIANILSDRDARTKEWKGQAYKAWKYQVSKIREIFDIDCSQTKLVFENPDDTLDQVIDDDQNAFQYISVPCQDSEEINLRRKCNPERIPEQCLTDCIASRLGLHLWNDVLTDDKKETVYNALRRIDFNTAYLQEQLKVTDNDIFAEALSCMLTGRKMYKGNNIEYLLKDIINTSTK